MSGGSYRPELNCFQHSSRLIGGEIESAYEKVEIKIVTVQRDLARGEADGLQKQLQIVRSVLLMSAADRGRRSTT
jgi:hypothetical protein